MIRFAYLLPVLFLTFGIGCSTTPTQTAAHRSTASESLTEYDKSIIDIYMRQGYQTINHALRVSVAIPELDLPFVPGKGALSEIDHKFYAQLNKALQKTPRFVSAGKSFVYRGVLSLSSKPEDRYPKGKVFRDLSYGSSTKDIQVANKFMTGQDKILYTDIDDPKMKRQYMTMIKINSLSGRDISAINKEEAEVLFPPGAIFRIDQAQREKGGHYLVVLTELDPAKMTDAEKTALKKSDDLHRDKRLKEAYMQDGAKNLDQKAMAADIATAKANYKKRMADGILLREDLKYEDIVEPGYD